MRRIILVIVAAAVLVQAFGCASGAGKVSSERGERTILIATDATFPPFHHLDDQGEPVGYDVEVAKEAARRAGREARIVVVRPYERLWEGLQHGEHHAVTATTGVTPERAERWLFTTPYFETCQAAIVRVGAGEPRSVTELASRRIGAAGDGTSWMAARSVHGASPVQLGKGVAGIPALRAGEIDALVVDEYEAVRAARESGGDLRVLPMPVMIERYAIVIHPDNELLREALSAAIDAMRADGTLESLQQRHGVLRDDDWPLQRPE